MPRTRQKRKPSSKRKSKQQESLLHKYWKLLVVALALASVGVASAALISPSLQNEAQSTRLDPSAAVYRPSEKSWVDVTLSELRPLDFLVKDGEAYHVKAPANARTGQIAAAPLGITSYNRLNRHLSAYDPEDNSSPSSDTELVYAMWGQSDLWTFQPLGKLKSGDLFHYNGREFITRVSRSGSRSVKPTGNVLSPVNGVWAEHHDNQIHLTLFFPELGESNKIITTHEHPFYVPTSDSWVPAGDLKIGMALQTCDGTSVRVSDWVVVDEPLTAWNIEVANSHTYYVADPTNPNAPPVLVHNDCLPKNWKPRDIKDEKNWNGCEACAKDIQSKLGGGTIVRITPEPGAPSLGGYRGVNPRWSHHEVVVKDGRVYDAFGPRGGVPIKEYKKLFQYPDAIAFGF